MAIDRIERSAMEHSFVVNGKDAGSRLDVWLQRMMPKYSRKQIKTLLDDGRVLVNRRRVLIAGWELEPEDNVEVRIPPNFGREDGGEDRSSECEVSVQGRESRPSGREPGRSETAHHTVRASIERHLDRRKKPHHAHAPAQHAKQGQKPGQQEHRDRKFHKLKVYYEDKHVIVVEKPSGVLSVAAEGRREDSFVDDIRAYLKRRHKGREHSFVAPLHRLDTETSGVMVFALSREGQRLESQFRDHSIRREYTAIVAGRVEGEQGIIDTPLEKGEFGHGKKVREAEQGGKKAITEYRVIERYGNATLLEVKVRTGRTHQIRVHLAAKGHPLIGDKLYNEGMSDEALDKAPHLKRQALHANLLGFRHPASGKKMMFRSALPHDIKGLIDSLRQG